MSVEGPLLCCNMIKFLSLKKHQSEEMTKFYMSKILKCVQVLHSKGVYHRDLKLENIFMMNDSSILKVGDLGHSIHYKSLQNGKARGVKGSLLYTPLEIYDFQNGYDPIKIDTFCCAIIMFAIRFNFQPFFQIANKLVEEKQIHALDIEQIVALKLHQNDYY